MNIRLQWVNIESFFPPEPEICVWRTRVMQYVRHYEMFPLSDWLFKITWHTSSHLWREELRKSERRWRKVQTKMATWYPWCEREDRNESVQLGINPFTTGNTLLTICHQSFELDRDIIMYASTMPIIVTGFSINFEAKVLKTRISIHCLHIVFGHGSSMKYSSQW